MSKLYRGVSKSDDKKLGGKLIPNGREKQITMKYGDSKVFYDGKFKYGPSEENTARAHQINSGMHDGCCISTTRDKEVAKYFATSGGYEDGYVYVIDETKLEGAGVNTFEFNNPQEAHECEVTLMEKNGGEIPTCVIIEKYEVSAT